MECYAPIKKNRKVLNIVIWNNFQDKLLTEKYIGQILLISGPAWMELGCCHFILTTKKLNHLKNQIFFLTSVREVRENHCPQNWSGREADTYNHNLLEQKPIWKQVPKAGKSELTNWWIYKLQEAQCGHVWELKTPGKASS